MTLYCIICIQTFVVTCANISYFIGTFSLFRNVLPEAICCCLQTCYVAIGGLCVYTNFHCCHSLVTYTNSPL